MADYIDFWYTDYLHNTPLNFGFIAHLIVACLSTGAWKGARTFPKEGRKPTSPIFVTVQPWEIVKPWKSQIVYLHFYSAEISYMQHCNYDNSVVIQFPV